MGRERGVVMLRRRRRLLLLLLRLLVLKSVDMVGLRGEHQRPVMVAVLLRERRRVVMVHLLPSHLLLHGSVVIWIEDLGSRDLTGRNGEFLLLYYGLHFRHPTAAHLLYSLYFCFTF